MDRFAAEIERLKAAHSYRTLRPASGLDFTSNDYLGLAAHPALREAAKKALDEYGIVGAGGSRLLRGHHPLHEALEARAADFFVCEKTLYFGSGYLANLALFSALCDRRDAVVFDENIHASMKEGIHASRAERYRARHNDVSSFEENLKKAREANHQTIWIAVEGLYSMDGDFADITQLVAIKNKYSATLIIDEAHAFGATGPDGLGVSHLQGVLNDIDVYVATFSKALGGAGGFIAANNTICQMLINHSRSFIYTTGLPAINCIAADAALDIISREPQRQKALWHNCDYFKKRCQEKGLSHGDSDSYIIPIFIGEASRALAISEALLKSQLLP